MPRPESVDFEITTSLRNDGTLRASTQNTILALDASLPCQFYMLRFHRDRILAAVQAFDRSCESLEGLVGLQYLGKRLQSYLESKFSDPNYPEPLKIRIAVSRAGILSVTSTPTQTLQLRSLFPSTLSQTASHEPSFTIFVSPSRTSPSLFTTHKTSCRPHYDDVRSLFPSSSENGLPMEVLFVNLLGEIMEGSISTPYFYREGVWVTPAEACGGNMGTTRRWALENGLCKDGIINVESVVVGEKVVLSNGVRGWGWGRVEVV